MQARCIAAGHAVVHGGLIGGLLVAVLHTGYVGGGCRSCCHSGLRGGGFGGSS